MTNRLLQITSMCVYIWDSLYFKWYCILGKYLEYIETYIENIIQVLRSDYLSHHTWGYYKNYCVFYYNCWSMNAVVFVWEEAKSLDVTITRSQEGIHGDTVSLI